MKNVLKFLAILFIIYQFVAWFGSPYLYTGREHPLSDIQGFVVDDGGNVIIGDGFYQIIQSYDKNGRYLASWTPNASGGAFEMFLGDNNTIIISPYRIENTQTYTIYGQAVNKTENISKNNETNKSGYKLAGGMFFPKLIYSDGKTEKMIVRQSIMMNLLKAPFPFFGAGCVFLIIFGIRGIIKKLKEERF